MKQQLNPPANWNDFEDLCHKLWRSIWGGILILRSMVEKVKHNMG